MGKYIRLATAIIIPLVVGAIIWGYGFQRYRTGDFINAYADMYISQGETTVEKLDIYTEYTSYKYKEEKFTTEVNSSLGKIFDVDVWATLEEDSNEIDYVFYLYNINYTRLNELRGLGTTVDESTFARIRMMVIPEEGDEVIPEAITMFVLDYDALPDKDDQDVPVTVKKMVFKTNNFSPDTYLKFYYDNPSDPLDYRPDDQTFKPGLDHTDYAVVQMGDFFTETKSTVEVVDGINNDLMNAGYSNWVVSKYLWWQALIGFVVVFGITLSFHIVWEYDNKVEAEKKIKKQTIKK